MGALIVVCLYAGLSYGVLQQIERQGANDTPSRLASQIVSEPSDGRNATIDGLPRVDLSNSLEPFVVVFGSDGRPVYGNGFLAGSLASPPSGVIQAAHAGGRDQVTWQTSGGLRFAIVAIESGKEVVVAGQSLRPSESRTDAIGALVLLGGLASVFVLAAAFALWEMMPRMARQR